MIDDVREFLMRCDHKEGVNRLDWMRVHDSLPQIALTCFQICKKRNIPFLVTSIIRPRIEGVSATDIHADGRAFDLSVRGFTTDDLDELLVEVNKMHAKASGAVSKHDGVPRALIYEHKEHEGPKTQIDIFEKINQAVPHLHGQCRR